MLETLFTLLVAFQIKHFLADYPLQTTRMLDKAKTNLEWIAPLVQHCSVHAAGTFIITAGFTHSWRFAVMLTAVDFSIHFLIDRLKASPFLGGRFKPNQNYYWWALGADQMAHHLTHYGLIFLIIQKMGLI